MNKTEIRTDGICVYVNIKIKTDKKIKWLIRVAFFSVFAGIVLMAKSSDDTSAAIGILLLIIGVIVIVPMCKTILWNLYGEENLSFSTKSIVQELSYGFIKLNPKTYLYDGRLNCHFELLRDYKVKEGRLHFHAYDNNNQPYHLFQPSAYLTPEDCDMIIEKLRLIFLLETDYITEYSAN